jgi:hypothetical protein
LEEATIVCSEHAYRVHHFDKDDFNAVLLINDTELVDTSCPVTEDDDANCDQDTLHNEMGPGGAPYAPPYVRRVRIYAHGTFCFTPRLIYPFFVSHPPCA